MSKKKYTGRSPNLEPNTFLILILILSYFGHRPMYYIDKELLKNKHRRASENGANEARDTGYTGSVLSEDNDSQDEASSNIKYEGSIFEEKEKENMEISEGGYSKEDISTLEGYPAFTACNCDMGDNAILNTDFVHNTNCSQVIESEIVPEYPSKLIMPEKDNDQMIISVPVILSQFEIEFSCESMITLDQPAIDIKRIKKNVFLNECRLLPKVNKLFIGGIVRKNIEYSTKNNIRHTTVEIPFKCTTTVEYFTSPIIRPSEEYLEIETLRNDGMGADLNEKSYVNSEQFSEKIYCKLVSDEIRELDLFGEADKEEIVPECERSFETLTEKMIVKLNLKLIQEQEININ